MRVLACYCHNQPENNDGAFDVDDTSTTPALPNVRDDSLTHKKKTLKDNIKMLN